MLDGYLEEVKEFLKIRRRDVNVVVMPDFFLDRFINLNTSPRHFNAMVTEVVKRKGGSIDGISQKDFRGGNAINTAAALASLGIKVTPIICTDRLGLQLLKFHIISCKVNLSHIKIMEKPSITTAIEFKTSNGKANVMIRDLGSLEDFGPQNLDEKDFEAIEKADYICVFNWAGTRKFGTELAEKVFRHTKTKGKGKTYYDAADPTPNKKKARKLLEKVLKSDLVDILSLNENEAIFYSSLLKNKLEKPKESLKFEESAKESAKLLSLHLKARVDLHTTCYSATFAQGSETIIPAFHVKVLRATGAGDAWNAGNILGSVYELPNHIRLTLANAVAAYYVSSSEGKHATLKTLIRFCERLKGRWKTKTDKN